MEYYKKLRIVVLFLYVTGVFPQCENREPHCYSRFDYEYKVLQRLIRLEETQNDVTEKLTTSENEKDDLKREIKKLEESHKGLSEKLAGSENERDELKHEIKIINEMVSNLSDSRAVEQGNYDPSKIVDSK